MGKRDAIRRATKKAAIRAEREALESLVRLGSSPESLRLFADEHSTRGHCCPACKGTRYQLVTIALSAPAFRSFSPTTTKPCTYCNGTGAIRPRKFSARERCEDQAVLAGNTP